MPSQSYEFLNAVNYNQNNTEIVANEVKLTLADKPSQIFSQDFASSTGFIFDAAKTEFVAGVMRQKDQSPTDSILAALYDSVINSNWNKEGALLATLNGVPTIVSNKLQCFGTQGVEYAVSNHGIGAVKFKYTPNYTGGPASNINIVNLVNTADNNSRMTLTHSPSGDTFRIFVTNSTGTVVWSTVTIGGAVGFVTGTTYEIELNWDNVAGDIRVFVDGNLQGSRLGTTWTHGTGAADISLGANPIAYDTADGSFEDLVLFSSVQHTANYTIGYSLPLFLYVEDKADLPNFVYTDVGALVALTNTTMTEVGSPKYTIEDAYHNGTAWVVSNGTYGQANDLSTVVANLATLSVSGETVLSWSVVFPDSNILSSVDDLSITYTGQKYNTLGHLEPVLPINVQSLLDYDHNALDETGNAYTRVILKIDNQLTYWNGAAWVNSDGTELQSNTLADVTANVGSLVFGSNSTVFVRWLLISSADNETPLLQNSIIEFDFGGVVTTLAKCLVYGYYKDLSDIPVAGATVKFSLKRDKSVYQEANQNIVEAPVETTTDSNGYFEKELIRTSEYSVGGNYKLEITRKSGGLSTTRISDGVELTFTVPDAEMKDITDLLPGV